MKTRITAGFIPLLDSAILVTAREKGFAADEDIDLNLVRETSWANIRDRMAVGHFEVAHMLAPMPIASNLGITPLELQIIAPFALGLGGNAVTVSNSLWQAMAEAGLERGLDPVSAGKALRKVIADRLALRQNRLVFAVVHPHSGHNLELRYWLAGCGIDPDRDIDIIIIPPTLMADALSTGRIDGYCVGEPWNSVAVANGVGDIVTTKASIWRSSPEKVLGVRADWAVDESEVLAKLIRALHAAAQWCADRENLEELASILADKSYLDLSPDIMMRAVEGNLSIGGDMSIQIEDFFVPFARAATFPWQSHALWFYSQMVRWGLVTHSQKNTEIARNAYRPDLYRNALMSIGAAIPGANSKVEGALPRENPVGVSAGRLTLGPDGFFDGKIFDPDRINEYIASQQNPSKIR